MSELYIGLMSGTSVDGIDAALVEFNDGKITLIDFHYQSFPEQLRRQIQQISQPDQPILLKDYGKLDSHLGQLFAEAALTLLDKTQLPPERIHAIGSHGQTVYHAPESPNGFSLQIGDPNRIAELTGITTVADFRRRDIACGGQGAPLVPAFHQAIFADPLQAKTILNIGGIANITVLNHPAVMGFDTGPGNAFMDSWCQQHLGTSYDRDGHWAATGQIQPLLLSALKSDAYFQLAPPKSTGKEYFSTQWLQQKLQLFSNIKAEDVQATLCQLTADSIAEAIRQHAADSQQVLVCGGGAHNRQLLKQLQQQLTAEVVSTASVGIDPDHVEAIAFAWLARQTLNKLPGNLCSVTGASSPALLGGIYPGKTGFGR